VWEQKARTAGKACGLRECVLLLAEELPHLRYAGAHLLDRVPELLGRAIELLAPPRYFPRLVNVNPSPVGRTAICEIVRHVYYLSLLLHASLASCDKLEMA